MTKEVWIKDDDVVLSKIQYDILIEKSKDLDYLKKHHKELWTILSQFITERPHCNIRKSLKNRLFDINMEQSTQCKGRFKYLFGDKQ